MLCVIVQLAKLTIIVFLDDLELREAMAKAAESMETYKHGSFELLFNPDAFKPTVTYAKDEVSLVTFLSCL